MSILVAVDLSPASEKVVEAARKVAKLTGAAVYILHAAEPEPDFVGYDAGPEVVRTQVAQELRREHREVQAVRGIDLAVENLQAAKIHAAAGQLEVEYREVDVDTIADEQPDSFDIVTCLELLEHVPDPANIVAACARAVRPGGAVFFSTINRNLKSFLLAIVGAEYVLGMLPKGTHEYLKLIRPAELASACRAAGLDIEELTGLHFNPLVQTYSLGGNVDVNYFAYAIKPGPA